MIPLEFAVSESYVRRPRPLKHSYGSLIDYVRGIMIEKGIKPTTSRFMLGRHNKDMAAMWTFNSLGGYTWSGRLQMAITVLTCGDASKRSRAYFGVYDRETDLGYPTHHLATFRLTQKLLTVGHMLDSAITAATYERIVDGPGGMLNSWVDFDAYCRILVAASRAKFLPWYRIAALDAEVAKHPDGTTSHGILMLHAATCRVWARSPIADIRDRYALGTLLPCPLRDELIDAGLFELGSRTWRKVPPVRIFRASGSGNAST